MIARIIDPGVLRTSVWIVLVSATVAIALVRSVRASRANDYLAVAAIVGCATAALSPISWTHHLGFLLVALVAFVVQATTFKAKALCAIAWLILVDPAGHGDEPWLSTVRALMVIGAVCCTPIRSPETVKQLDNNQTETTPSNLETNSALPS